MKISVLRQVLMVVGTIGVVTMTGYNQASAVNEGEDVERITMSPSSLSLKLDAGQATSGTVKVINDGDVAYGFSVYARPYSVKNELYDPDFATQQTNAGVYKWIQFEQTKYRLEPGQTIEVKYTIRVPANATPGGHYGVLFAETDERGVEGTGVARKKRVGNLLYVTVNGDYETEGSLKEFILPTWQTKAPMISSVRIENTGNVDFPTKISTTAKDVFGRTKYQYNGDPIVLPGTVRLAEMRWENAPNFGLFKVEQSVEFLDKAHKNSGYVLIAPRWAPIALIIMVGAGAGYAVLQRRSSRR